MINETVLCFAVLLTVAVLLAYGEEERAMTGAARQSAPVKGGVVFGMDFETALEREKWSEAATARWVNAEGKGTCLHVDVPTDQADGMNMVKLPLDLKGLQNCKILFECAAKAEDVTKPPHSYNGIKYMFHCVSASRGSSWHNENNLFGSFYWKRLACSLSVPDDVQQALIFLGLQESIGKVWFDDLNGDGRQDILLLSQRGITILQGMACKPR